MTAYYSLAKVRKTIDGDEYFLCINDTFFEALVNVRASNFDPTSISGTP